MIATGFFSGYSPWASGTAGTLVGILLYLLPGIEAPIVFIPLILTAFAAGVLTSRRIAEVEGHRLTATAAYAKEKFQKGADHAVDPSIVVIDEIVGVWISLLWMPKTVFSVVACFFVFRILDVLKPEPARMVERIPNGWGIMLDDVVAGVYTNMICRILVVTAALVLPQLR
jgi:phosphatidylglycerophosphatase A